MDLASLIAAARKTNPRVVGVAVYNQSDTGERFVAFCLDRQGKSCDPRSWETHPTPEGALADLERQLAK